MIVSLEKVEADFTRESGWLLRDVVESGIPLPGPIFVKGRPVGYDEDAALRIVRFARAIGALRDRGLVGAALDLDDLALLGWAWENLDRDLAVEFEI